MREVVLWSQIHTEINNLLKSGRKCIYLLDPWTENFIEVYSFKSQTDEQKNNVSWQKHD